MMLPYRFAVVDARVKSTSERRHFAAQNASAGDERKMGEGLGKIPQLTFCARIVFFGKKTEVVSQREQAFE